MMPMIQLMDHFTGVAAAARRQGVPMEPRTRKDGVLGKTGPSTEQVTRNAHVEARFSAKVE